MTKKMNIINKLQQEFVVDKIKKTDWKIGASNPLVVELDTTEVCNLACPGCISEDMLETKNRFSDKRLMQLGEEFNAVGVKAVILIGGGEPLAHPRVGEFMNYLGENDIHIGITTNGTLIDKYLDVIAKYSNWTRISMDAGSDEMYNKLRPSKDGVSKFHKVVENMRELAKIKKGKLGYSYLIRTAADGFGLESNIHEIYDAAVLARNIGCDYFEVKPSYQYADGIDHALVKHSKEDMDKARIEINRLDELETASFSIVKSINLESSLNGIENPQDKEYTTCPVTELRTLICPSGVFVCPYWRGKEKFKVGELNNSSFVDMWNGEKRNEVMGFLDPSKHCSFHCLRHESNLEVFKMIEKTKNNENMPILNEFDRFI